AGLEPPSQDSHMWLRQHEPGVGSRHGLDLQTACGKLIPSQSAVVPGSDLPALGPKEDNVPWVYAWLVLLERGQIGLRNNTQIELAPVTPEHVALGDHLHDPLQPLEQVSEPLPAADPREC